MRDQSTQRPDGNDHDSDDEDEYDGACELPILTREDVLRMVGENAIRVLGMTEKSISYVAYWPEMEDYTHVEYILDERHGWMEMRRALLADERLPGEMFTDERILQVARMGKMIQAIRLYRIKYGVGLREGAAAVDRLVSDQQ